MKKVKISLLALSILAGGSLAASAAASPVTYGAYILDLGFTNLEVWSIEGAISSPSGSTTFPIIENNTFAETDGSGKITGGGDLTISWNSNNVPESILFVDISGKISSTTAKPTPAVTLQIKGSGFTIQDHTVLQTATPLSANLKFTGNATGSNILGTVSGTITGNTPLGTKTAKVTNLPVVLNASQNNPDLNSAVLQSSKGQMTLWSVSPSSTFSGNGNVKSGTSYTANLKGVDLSKGSSVSLNGAMGTYTNGVSGTNTGISFTAPTTATISKGSIKGQAVSGAATSVTASLIH
jgi:hypothetical protein